ncbi:glycine betaine ABC transporter substrate-binding protein [Sphingobium yanoikuyae]|uniref:Glycine/betaine ABC transporter substrate-binding protein n=1 Tax=Sphingobium yanoikuyae TaxID=13690 RepID=A0A291MY35_SPHYA|nr:glycine betaine ABC transporter substrate-binding protein [Sphingobium yanoikuyae]ATI80017.1 glycine/betaine ABC transporter substrate-binding protein [Sphingobium yanoikuyae]
MTALHVGHIDLGFHDASALEVEAILRRHGHGIERSAAPHEEMFKRMGRGEVDILVSAWLPASHGAYLAPFADDVRKITVLYEPYCIWGVPDYVADEVMSVSDLLTDPALLRMDRLIQGINPGAGISRFSQAIVEYYGLGAAGYHFETGTEAQCFDRFEEAVSRHAWVVVPLWHPQYLHARYRIRELAEPAGLLGGTDQATLIVRREAEKRISAAALEELAGLHLGNQRVSELEDQLVRSKPPS